MTNTNEISPNIVRARAVKVKSCTETLKSLVVGQPYWVAENDFDVQALHKRASDLRKSGYEFEVVKNRHFGVTFVTRLK